MFTVCTESKDLTPPGFEITLDEMAATNRRLMMRIITYSLICFKKIGFKIDSYLGNINKTYLGAGRSG